MPISQVVSSLQNSAEAKQYQASGAVNPFTTASAPAAGAAGSTATGTGAFTNAAGGASTVNPNASFYLSPDYNFQLSQGLGGLTAQGAATNGTNNGAQQKAEIAYAGNLASGEYQNYKNGLMSLAGLGTSANSTSAAAGQSNANSQSSILTNQGNNTASSYLGQGAIGSNLLTGLSSNLTTNKTAYQNALGLGTGAGGDNGDYTSYGGYNVGTGF